MAYSEAGLAGKKRFGRKWRGYIYAKSHVNRAVTAIAASDRDAIVSSFRSIHKSFSKHTTDENTSGGEEDALEWFEQETPDYEIENGLIDKFRQEFEYRMGELYDFADYNRLLIK